MVSYSKKLRIRFVFVVFLTLFFLYPLWTTTSVKAESGEEYIQKLGYGINLSNSFEVDLEDASLKDVENLHTIFKNIRLNGYQSVRIPITWIGHWNEETKQVEEEYLDQIGEVVNIAIGEDVAVVLTMYHDSWEWLCDISNQAETFELYQTLWSQIANYFKGYDVKVSFEGINEPYFDNKTYEEQLTILNQLHTVFVDTVRKTGGNNSNRILLLSTLNSAITEETTSYLSKFMKEKADPNLVASVHYYGQWEFSVNAANRISFSSEVIKHMDGAMALLDRYFTKQGMYVVCTEFGLYGHTSNTSGAINHGEVLKYYEYLFYKAKTVKLPLMLWDNGKYYNPSANRWYDSKIKELFLKSRTTRSSYGSVDAIYQELGMERKETSIALSLHEEKLQQVLLDGKVLKLGAEYTLEGNTLVIQAEVFESLSKISLGEIGKIILEFSDGCPWEIVVYQYKKPTLKSSRGSLEQLVIEGDISGNNLVNMESKDEEGNNVGPLTYSSFQEYGYSYWWEKETGDITLTNKFIATMPEEKPVKLVFYFASGDILSYVIQRRGTIVEEVGFVEAVGESNSVSIDEVEKENANQLVSAVETENKNVQNIFKLLSKENIEHLIWGGKIILSVILFVSILVGGNMLRSHILRRKEVSVIYMVEEEIDEPEPEDEQ